MPKFKYEQKANLNLVGNDFTITDLDEWSKGSALRLAKSFRIWKKKYHVIAGKLKIINIFVWFFKRF